MNVPNLCLNPGEPIDRDVLALLILLIKAYDNAVFRNHAKNGEFAISDSQIARWVGCRSTAWIRRARKKLMALANSAIEVVREGRTTYPTQYKIRLLGARDQVEFPAYCTAVEWRTRTDSDAAQALKDRTAEVLDAALEYGRKGFHVVPLSLDKHPFIPWKRLQTEMLTEPELVKYFARGTANIGIVTGKASDLVVVDFDGDEVQGRRALREAGVNLPITTTVRSGKGGCHAWFRYPAWDVGSPTDIFGTKDDAGFAIDVRGDGGIIVAPPSVHGVAAKPYEFVEIVDALPLLPDSMRQLLHRAKGKRTGAMRTATRGLQRAADVKQQVSIVDFCRQHNIALHHTTSGELVGLCPLHEESEPSFYVNPTTDLFFCHGCRAGGDVIALYAQFHDISPGAAIAVLSAA